MTTPLLVTFTTLGAVRLACNWLESVRRLGLDDRAFVYCGDDGGYAAVEQFTHETGNRAGFKLFQCPRVENFSAAIDWGTRAFVSISLGKLAVQLELNDQEHFEPYLFCDADTVLLGDPTEYLERVALAPISLHSDAADECLPSTESNLINVGIHYCAQPVPQMFAEAQGWLLARLGSLSDYADGNYVDDQQAVCRAIEQTRIVWGVLDPARWRNGRQHWPAPDAIGDVLLVHANWIVGVANKIRYLKQKGFWFAKASGQVQLLVGYYDEPNPARAVEYEICMRRNLANLLIERVFVFLRPGSQIWPDVAEHRKVTLCYTSAPRLRYSDLFGFASSQLAGKVCVVANSDVLFDDSLEELCSLELAGKMLCVSRHDSMVPYSQDAWMFEAPLPAMEADIELGIPSCDNRIAYEAERAGLQLSNPCHTIRVTHVHGSGIRNYDRNVAVPGPRLEIPPEPALQFACLPGQPSPPVPPFNPPVFRDKVDRMGFNPFIHVFGVQNLADWKK
jgi:hypothetical protein